MVKIRPGKPLRVYLPCGTTNSYSPDAPVRVEKCSPVLTFTRESKMLGTTARFTSYKVPLIFPLSAFWIASKVLKEKAEENRNIVSINVFIKALMD
jgi:hypothetical protein